MKRVAIFFGGCGARVAESLVFAACAGVLAAPDMHLVFVDPDASDPHGARAATLLADYERVRALCAGSPTDGAFQTAITAERWPARLPDGEAGLHRWVREDTEDAWLLRAMFTPEAAERDLRQGFHGDRALGAAVFSGLLREADSDPEDALYRLANDPDGEDMQIVLVGSVCGGTGGAGMPAVAAWLRERLGERARLSCVMLLPYGAGEQPSEARAALRRWRDEGVRMPVCLLGLPDGARCRELTDAARLNEWLAVYALDWFLRHDASDAAAYTYRTEAAGLTWGVFGRDAEAYDRGYGRLLKTAALFRLSLTDELTARLSRPGGLMDRLGGWYAACCRGAVKATEAERRELLEELRALTELLDGALGWAEQLCLTMPEQLRRSRALEEAMDAARRNEEAVVGLSARLEVLTREARASGIAEETVIHRAGSAEENEVEETQRRLADMAEQLRALEEAQPPLNRHAGGRETVEMLRALEAQCRHDAENVRAQVREANRRIDRAEAIAEPREQYRILAARTKMKPMQRNLAMQEERVVRAARDLDAALAHRWDAPAVTPADEITPCLFRAEALALMHPPATDDRKALRQYARDQEAAFTRLLVRPEDDAQTLRRVLQAIAKVRAGEEHPLACLLSRALANV